MPAMENKRVYRQPIRQDWAEALLGATPAQPPDFLQEGFETVAELLALGRDLLGVGIEQAQRALDDNPLTEVVAQAAAREAGKRGDARLVVDPDGTVMLEVGSGQASPQPKDEPQAKWQSKLPTLDELRSRAEELGVDISDLGRAKRKILKRLEDGGAGDTPAPAPVPVPEAPPAPPARKRIKRAEALTPAKILHLTPDPEPVVVPDPDPEPDEPEVGDDDTKTDESAIQQAVEAKTVKPKVDMAALASQAGGLDLDALLSKLDED